MIAANKYTFQIVGKDKTGKAFGKIKSRLDGVAKKIGQVSAAIGTGVLVGVTALVKRSLELNDVLAKTSDRLGIATDKLAGLQHAANQTGASSEALNMGLQRMVRRIGQVAATGKGEAAPALARLGLEAAELAKLSPDQQFARIADKMKDVASQGEKVFLTQKLFDSEGVKLLNTLELGADGLKKMQEEAERLGIAMSRVDAAKIEAANDAMDKVNKRVQGIGNAITVEVAPLLEIFSEKLLGIGGDASAMGGFVRKAFWWGVRGAGVFADGLHGVSIILQSVTIAARTLNLGIAQLAIIVTESAATMHNALVGGLLAPFRKGLELAAMLPESLGGIGSKAQEALAGLDQIQQRFSVDVPTALYEFRDAQAVAFDESLEKMKGLLGEDLPSTLMTEKLEEIFNEADLIISKRTEKILEDTRRRKDAANKTDFKANKDKYKTNESGEKKHHSNLLKILTGGSEKMTAVTEGMNLVQTVQATYTGAIEAYKSLAGIPIVGPALGAAAALKVTQFGFKALAGVKSARGGGGSISSPGISQSTPSIPSSSISDLNPIQEQSNNQVEPVINFIVSGGDPDSIIQSIKDRINNDDFNLIDPNSRNGQELRTG